MSEICRFCSIARKEIKSNFLLEDEHCLAFLDIRPVFPGHALLIPKEHVETFMDLPEQLIQSYIVNAQRLGRAIERGLRADGVLMAVNNRISQSVPHLHMHLIPRRRKDGLKGFFWPRRPYQSEEETIAIQNVILEALKGLSDAQTN